MIEDPLNTYVITYEGLELDKLTKFFTLLFCYTSNMNTTM